MFNHTINLCPKTLILLCRSTTLRAQAIKMLDIFDFTMNLFNPIYYEYSHKYKQILN